ncbi:MAG: hypothetical protein WCW14_04025 [Candidatus Paceibacterota bacterium]|jgi:hypothetical protein
MKKVFLGGTCGNNNWREQFITELTLRGVSIEQIVNPVVSVWNEEVKKKEEETKKEVSHMFFYLADPKQEENHLSAYSMVEATMATYDKLSTTAVVFDMYDMSGDPLTAMTQAMTVIKERFPQAKIFTDRASAIDWLVKELL